MLEGLDAITWADSPTAWGADTPVLIRALASPDRSVRAAALERLHTTIWHQCSVYLVSVKAVPFLIELLGHETVADKHAILRLLADLGANDPASYLGNPGKFWDVATFSTWEEEGRRAETDPADVFGWTTAAVRDGSEVYAPLLAHDAARVRATAAYVLGFVGCPADAMAERVRLRLAIEADPSARASLILALAMLGLGTKPNPDVRLFEAALSSPDAPLLRIAAAAALAWIHRGDLCAEARATLTSAAGSSLRADADGFPWRNGDVSGLARQILEELDAH
jgi:hypothetical protein